MVIFIQISLKKLSLELPKIDLLEVQLIDILIYEDQGSEQG